MDNWAWPSVATMTRNGQAAIVLACEHASAFIPPDLKALGVSDDTRKSHAAWDIGALDVARRLSKVLDAPLVAGQVSRMVYDCNRPLEAPDCIPAKSEIHAIPGNADLNDQDRQSRFDQIHSPFHDELDQVLNAQISRCDSPVALITIHSFTPVFHGKHRAVELGFLYHSAPALSQAALQIERGRGVLKAAINEPYSASDGVTYTLIKHAEARGLPNVMIEIRNDLIDTPEKAQDVADHLAQTLRHALAQIQQEAPCS